VRAFAPPQVLPDAGTGPLGGRERAGQCWKVNQLMFPISHQDGLTNVR
jgi:hypothetical protein